MLQVSESLSEICNMWAQRDVAFKIALCATILIFNITMLRYI